MSRPATDLQMRPRLRMDVHVAADGHVDEEPVRSAVERTLRRMDGTMTVAELARCEPAMPAGEIESLLASLDEAGVVDDHGAVPYVSGIDAILEIEELVEQHCNETIFRNPFWVTCLSARQAGDVPEKLAAGMIIENWHFLFRESYFDAPVLSYVPNTEVRLLLNRFFSEEYGHDEILLRSLKFLGLTREDMHDAIPLPETMALCNALAHWAHTDPLFFFTTLGLLEGQGMKHDSFIAACEASALPDELVGPLRIHANININSAHGSLTRAIFRHIPALDDATVARLKRQVRPFVELYDDFYFGVWRYYTSDAPLLRRVSEL